MDSVYGEKNTIHLLNLDVAVFSWHKHSLPDLYNYYVPEALAQLLFHASRDRVYTQSKICL
jgi:hypothetical protein